MVVALEDQNQNRSPSRIPAVYHITPSRCKRHLIWYSQTMPNPLVSEKKQSLLAKGRNSSRGALAQQNGPGEVADPPSSRSGQALNRQSLSEVAYERLLGMLRSRELQPNDLINERHLARQLNVSRTPLREAIRRLEGEKILERQSSGTLVVRPVSIEDLLYICQVRRLVEGEAARRAAGRIAASELEQLRRRYMSFKEKGGPIPATAPIVRRDLHLLIAEACGNPILASIIRELKNRSQLLSVSTPE